MDAATGDDQELRDNQLAEGLGDEEISERLFVSPKTVRNQMVSILNKLGTESRLQALVVAVRYGIVEIT